MKKKIKKRAEPTVKIHLQILGQFVPRAGFGTVNYV